MPGAAVPVVEWPPGKPHNPRPGRAPLKGPGQTDTFHRESAAQMATKPLDGKSIVIVGGTTGLGRSAAAACIAAGARVLVVGRNRENVDRAVLDLGEECRGHAGDASDPGTSARAIDAALREYGAFDGLYHVAGGSGRRRGDGALHEITDEGWEFTVKLNLTSLFFSNRAAVRQFLRQGSGGSVLNVGSVLGFHPSPRYFSTHAYAATKAAVVGMTLAAASHYASHDIRFNVIAPAVVETPMARRAASDPEIRDFLSTRQPLDGGRLGRPEDTDAAVVYFLSDASRYVTGQVLHVDGGWTVSEGQHPRRDA